MKRDIYIIRHAKAIATKYGVFEDIDRSLSVDGIVAANKIGNCLYDLNINFDKIVVSSAARALQTGVILARTTQYNVSNLQIAENLYLPSVQQLLATIKELPNDAKTIAIVAHNPGIADFAIQTGYYQPIKTAGIIHYQSNLKNWQDASIQELNLVSSPCNEISTSN